jgi:hypothetical protein
VAVGQVAGQQNHGDLDDKASIVKEGMVEAMPHDAGCIHR